MDCCVVFFSWAFGSSLFLPLANTHMHTEEFLNTVSFCNPKSASIPALSGWNRKFGGGSSFGT